MHLLLIINPHASSIANLTAQSLADQARDILDRQAGRLSYEIMTPDSPEEMRQELDARLATGRVDRVVVAGGDGTIQETLEVMLRYPQVSMAQIPLGTGNLLALNLGVPSDPAGALKIAVDGKVLPIDLGTINGVAFVLNASIGIDAEIMKKTDRRIKRRLGKLAYYVTGLSVLPSFRHVPMKIETDGQIVLTRAVGINIATARMRMPGGLTLSPEGSPDDGQLHVTVFKMRKLFDYATFFLQLLISFKRPSRVVTSFNARRVRVQTWPALMTQADGNLIGETPATIEVLDQKLLFCVPPPPTDVG